MNSLRFLVAGLGVCWHRGFVLAPYLDPMPTIDIESLTLPVDPDQPSGEDLEYDPLFIEMEQAAAGKPEQQMGDATIEAEEPDWLLVQRNAIQLLERSKDLRSCIYLCEAALHNEGLEALSDALQLANAMTQSLWETLHPQLDEDDDNDPTARVNTVMALTSPKRLLRPLEQTPLISVPMLGSICWDDVKPVSSESEPRQLSDETHAIINHCELEQLAARRAAVQQALQACQGLETFITAQVGTSRAPNLEPLRTLLKRIDGQLNSWWTQRDGDQLAESASDDQQDDDAGDDDALTARPAAASALALRATGGAAAAPRGVGAITSRQEAIAAIDKILAYYREHEPSSPLPLLLQRARRLATKSFLEILQDLAPEGLGRAQELAGLTQHPATDSHRDGAVAEASTAAVPAASAPADTEDADDDFFS